jgi:hypothetical protein
MSVETTIEALFAPQVQHICRCCINVYQVLHLRRKASFYIFFNRHFAPDGAAFSGADIGFISGSAFSGWL